MKKRKINSLKEIENYLNYICYKEKKIYKKKYISQVDKLNEIHKLKICLYQDKKTILKQILYLKSAFSIIDEMFVKEMENAEIKKKYWFRRYFLFGFRVKEKTTDPRKINKFIREITNLYSDDNFEDVELGTSSQDKNMHINNNGGIINDYIKKIELNINNFDNNKKNLKLDLSNMKKLYSKLEKKLDSDDINANNDNNEN